MGLNLLASISLDGSNFERGMHRIGESAVDGIKKLVIQSVGVYTLEQAFSKTIETADELVNTSKRLGVGVEQLQVLKQAAKDNNVEFSQLATTFERIDIARAKALGGGAESRRYLQDFRALGVDRNALMNQTATQLFQGQIAGTVGKSNPESLSLQLRDVLGRSFGPEIALLSTNFEELGAKMKQFGAIMSGENALQLKQFKEEMNMAGQIIEAQLAPALVLLSKGVILATASFATFVNMFKGIEWSDFLSPSTLGRKMGENYGTGEGILEAALIKVATMDSEARLKAFQLTNPISPKFGNEAGALATARRERIGEDSLTKVGNFLGMSKSAINSGQAMLVKHAETTAKATTKIAKDTGDILSGFKVHQQRGQFEVPYGGTRENNATIFPQ